MNINGFGIRYINHINIVSQEDNYNVTPLEFTFHQLANPDVNYDEETGKLNISVDMCRCDVKEIKDKNKDDITEDNKNHDCLTFCYPTPTEYEVAVTRALKDGYKMESSSCNSKEWKAIMVR